jgi:drug/metabolite transporter (DMT)-like permease
VLQIIAFIVAGSLLIALVAIGQIRYVEPTLWPALKYNTMVVPLIILANALIFIAFTRATALSYNLPGVVGFQVGIYTLALALLSVLLLNGTISARTLVGIGLIMFGAALAR